MKTFKNAAAQGDIFISRVKSLPKNVKEAKIEDGKYIVAHSETGHHHVVEAIPGVHFFYSENPEITYLEVEKEIDLVHERTWDTHETLRFPKGIFQINRQREFRPEGWTRVED